MENWENCDSFDSFEVKKIGENLVHKIAILKKIKPLLDLRMKANTILNALPQQIFSTLQ